MEFTGKYTIVTGITSEYKINPQNPKYYAKFLNDDVKCLGITEFEAINNLKRTYLEYKAKGKLFPETSIQVLNTYTSAEKFHKYCETAIYSDFFKLLGEDPDMEIDDEFTLKDLEINASQIKMIKSKYNLTVHPEDTVVNIIEAISKSIF